MTLIGWKSKVKFKVTRETRMGLPPPPPNWPLDPKVDRAHPWLMGSVSVQFHEDRCKGEAVMCMKPFYLTHTLLPWSLDPKVHSAHNWLLLRLHVKIHEDMCKGGAVMRLKPFYQTVQSLHRDLDLLTPKSIEPILDSWGDCMCSFMRIGVKGKQLCTWNHLT